MSHRKEDRSGETLQHQADSPAEKPSPGFFVVVGVDTLQNKKLMIPTMFVNNYGDVLANDYANFVLPNCDVWKVGVTKSDNSIGFDSNWNDFVQHYSISHGYSLVFKYKCFSNFKVRIFDLSGCEIWYPSNSLRDEVSKNEKGCSLDCKAGVEDEDGDEVVILEKRARHEKTNEGECSSSQQKKGRNNRASTSLSLKSTRSKKVSGEAIDAENAGMKFLMWYADQEHEQANHSPKIFMSGNPYFNALLGEHNFLHNRVYIPSVFSKTYMRDIPEYTKFEVSDGRKWEVKVRRRANGRLCFGGGWKSFAKENRLKKGDTCVFELVNGNQFKVSVIYA